ncbi:hypothetical protein PPYR_14386 [Photinus pyralis]|uniref:Uncharacterized protein n=1 Tax=Photinus pyralis TaxID=7054 RepID=A0A1Y1L125_PHOPY|nr:nucleoporin NUP188 homolog [Photinus pyralis]KAB0792427.1 hypothetical protein PPYR_14386 [Photinus pyralis]
MDITPHWKRVWVTVNGKRNHIASSGASSALDVVKTYLFNGINMYKPFTETGYTSCWERLSYVNDVTFKTLMRKISEFLDLDTFTCFAMLCNYLKFECYVQVENCDNVIQYSLRQENLEARMWEFYTLERMFMLNLLGWIIENYQNEKHPFYELYRSFINEHTFKEIQKDLFKQYEALLKEMNGDRCNFERNYREQLQILSSVLSTFVYEKCDFPQFLYLIKLFTQNNCRDWHKINTDSVELGNLRAIQDVQIAIFLSSLYNLWDHYNTWYGHYNEIEGYMDHLYKNWRSPIIPLVWVTLHLSVNSNTALVHADGLQHHLGLALQFDVFAHLEKLVSNDLFMDTTTGIMVKASVFTVLEVLCIKLGANKFFVHPVALALLGKLLETAEIAAIWQQGSDEGTKSFYSSSLYCFPYLFSSLSTLVHSLIHLRVNAKEVVLALNDLQLYTEHYEHKGTGQQEREDVQISLTLPYRPLKNDLIIFPVGTKVTISKLFEDNVISYHGTYSYFSVLVHIVNTVFDEIGNCSPMIEEATIAGCKVLREIMRVDHTLISANNDAKELSRLLYCLFCTFPKMRVVNRKLLTLCFELIICELDHKPMDMLTPLLNVKMLPTLMRDICNSKDFADLNNLSASCLTTEICTDVYSPYSCRLIELYIKLALKCFQDNINKMHVILPALIFLIVKVLPIFATHLTSSNAASRRVCCKLIKLIHFILVRRVITNANDHIIYTCVIELFLKKEMFTSILFNICSIGNTRLEIILCGETNFVSGPSLKIVQSVKRALKCYMLISNYVTLNSHYEDWTPFRAHLMKSCFDKNFIITIQGYISHSYDEEIPQIAFEILGNISLALKKPLLPALKCGNSEVRQWIVQCFCDQLLRDPIKISIIHYISACVPDQPGMIVAFLNICPEKSEVAPDDKEKDMVMCMIDYLKNVEQNEVPEINSLQMEILEFLHMLWKLNKQFILKKVTSHENFWSVLTLPLAELKDSIYISLLTFEILTMELNLKKGQVSEKFKAALDLTFATNKNFTQLWIQRIIDIIKGDYVTPTKSHGLSLANVMLTVLKKFIIVFRHFLPTYDSNWTNYQTQRKCLDNLVYCVKNLNDAKLIALWAELYLILYKQTNQTVEEIATSLEVTSKLLSNFASSYSKCDSGSKTAILTIAAITLSNSEQLLSSNATYAKSFLMPFANIFEAEYAYLAMVETKKEESFYYNWVIILNVVNTFLRINFNAFTLFFNNTAYIERLTVTVRLYTQDFMPIRVAEVIMASLIRLAKSQLIESFDNQLKNMQNSLQQRNMCKLDEAKSTKGIVPQNIMNNWIFYTYVMHLNTILLKERGLLIFKDMLLFVHSHEANIYDAIASATLIANEVNLKLVSSTLRFMCEVYKYLRNQKKKNVKWFHRITMSITELLNACCNVLLHPSILVASKRSNTVNFGPLSNNCLITITNRYIDIVYWLCMCLIRWNPPLTEFLGVYQFSCESFVDYDDRAPPPWIVPQNQLTYNSLFCILHFICRVLTEISVMKDAVGKVKETFETLPSDCNIVIYPHKDASNTLSGLFGDALPQSLVLDDRWLVYVNPEKLTDSLNTLGTVIALQLFLTSRLVTADLRESSNIKWDFLCQLTMFYEFVYKYISHRMSHNQPLGPADPILHVDVSHVCGNRRSEALAIRSLDDSFLLLLIHWFRQICGINSHVIRRPY